MRRSTEILLKLGVLSLPVALCLVTYLLFDPFHLVHARAAFADAGNRDYVSTERFIRNVDREKYDSFIFGNSRSFAFLTSDWAPRTNAHAAFHFDASQESLFGILGKLKLIESRGVPIRNALLVVDSSVLSVVNDTPEHLFVKHPLISGSSWFAFHSVFFEAYTSPRFLFPYIYKKGTGRSLARFPIETSSPLQCDVVTNDCLYVDQERELARDPDEYYRVHAGAFMPRSATPAPPEHPVIMVKQRAMLQEIAAIFQAHGTSVQVIISPLYGQVPAAPDDIAVLNSLFGNAHVHDYSGVNDLTADIHNYYEYSHYRPPVARAILASIRELRGG